MFDITEIILAAIELLMAIAACLLIPYLKSKLNTETLAQIDLWATAAVRAAEMYFAGAGRGEEKKAYVIEFLAKKGFKLDAESIDAMIEAAVQKLKKNG